jgi:hypothetical protein
MQLGTPFVKKSYDEIFRCMISMRNENILVWKKNNNISQKKMWGEILKFLFFLAKLLLLVIILGLVLKILIWVNALSSIYTKQKITKENEENLGVIEIFKKNFISISKEKNFVITDFLELEHPYVDVEENTFNSRLLIEDVAHPWERRVTLNPMVSPYPDLFLKITLSGKKLNEKNTEFISTAEYVSFPPKIIKEDITGLPPVPTRSLTSQEKNSKEEKEIRYTQLKNEKVIKRYLINAEKKFSYFSKIYEKEI